MTGQTTARNALTGRLKYEAFAVAARIVPWLPIRLSYALADVAGVVAWTLTPRPRANVIDNLRHVLGPLATTGLLYSHTHSVYRNVARYYIDLLRLPRLDLRRFEREKLLDYGYAYLTEAVAEGRGVIVVTAHYGSPDLTIQAAGVRGLQFLVLTEPLDPPELAKLYLRLRASHGQRFLPVGTEALKETLRTLRRGGIVLLAVDRDIQGTGVEVPFFGAMARLPAGAVDLAKRTGAPIVPAFSRRLAGGAIELTIEPRVRLVETGDRDRDRRTNVQRVISRCERHLRQDPGQWLVLERIWPKPFPPP
ncbi:MAG: lysophospholipid acyltransferase family protein [Dehalococcoidia bacterium]